MAMTKINWTEIINFLIGSTTVVTGLIFISKFIIKWFGNAALERYKLEMQKESSRFQNILEKDLESFKIKYSRLHIEQVEIIKNLYSKLIKAEYPMEYLMRSIKWYDGRSEDDIAKEVIENTNDFFRYFDENEIILNTETCRLIELIRVKLLEAWKTYSNKKFAMDNEIRGPELVELVKKMRDAYDNILQGEIQQLKNELKNDFRIKLGITEK